MEYIRNKTKISQKMKVLENLGKKRENYENNFLFKTNEINTFLKIKAKRIKAFAKFRKNFNTKIFFIFSKYYYFYIFYYSR